MINITMESLRFLTNEYTQMEHGEFIKDYLLSLVTLYKPQDRWGRINSITFHFYDLREKIALFDIDCEGHGGLVFLADKGKISNTKEYKQAQGSFKKNITYERELVFFEEDCDYALGYNLLGEQQRKTMEEKRLKKHEEIERQTNNYTEYKPLSYYAKETIKHYYPNINIKF